MCRCARVCSCVYMCRCVHTCADRCGHVYVGACVHVCRHNWEDMGVGVCVFMSMWEGTRWSPGCILKDPPSSDVGAPFRPRVLPRPEPSGAWTPSQGPGHQMCPGIRRRPLQGDTQPQDSKSGCLYWGPLWAFVLSTCPHSVLPRCTQVSARDRPVLCWEPCSWSPGGAMAEFPLSFQSPGRADPRVS